MSHTRILKTPVAIAALGLMVNAMGARADSNTISAHMVNGNVVLTITTTVYDEVSKVKLYDENVLQPNADIDVDLHADKDGRGSVRWTSHYGDGKRACGSKSGLDRGDSFDVSRGSSC